MKKSEETRQDILQEAYHLIYTKGYQSTSIDDIITATRVTKGAFYYHFQNKDEMGLAMINEVMYPKMHQSFIEPIENSQSPAEDLHGMVSYLLLDETIFQPNYGCPIGNLIQEMSLINEQFNETLSLLTNQWEDAIVKCINRGKKAGLIKAETKSKQVAYFIISGYWGIRNFGKLQRSNAPYKVFLKELKIYLKSL
ncbi:MAG: TetR/AcrR family transcriptional regulator [bacterium]|nr:TetR/AcrR family transcriptional regulator [bacterium]